MPRFCVALTMVAVGLVLAAVATPLAAQGPRQPEFASVAEEAGSVGAPRLARIPTHCVTTHPGYLALGGVVGGTIGMFGGAYGLAAVTDGSSEDGDLYAMIVGGAIGEVVGVAMGVHLANGRRGSGVTDVLVSALGAIAGGFLAGWIPDPDYSWIAVPLVQLPVTIAVERLTARAKANRDPACRPI